jgi:REP element-mobilizing transposase RayT
MQYNPKQHHRRSIRLKEFDYTNPNWYYVTICAENKECLFGSVERSKVLLSDIGKTAEEFWRNVPDHFKYCDLDDYVIMPNHIHGIIIINECRGIININECRGVQLNARTDNIFSQISPSRGSLGVIIRTFKGAVKKWCNENGFQNFKWQRNYYEHIIRNEQDLYRIRKYIELNPIKWELDK